MTKFLKETFVKLIFSLGLVCLIIGCKGDDGMYGLDGQSGDPYIAYIWANDIYIINEAPGIPDYPSNGTFYLTEPGTWEYCYESWDWSLWCGAYTIYVNDGENHCNTFNITPIEIYVIKKKSYFMHKII